MAVPHMMEKLIKAVAGRPGWSVTYFHDDPASDVMIREPLVRYEGDLGRGNLSVWGGKVEGSAYFAARIGGSAGAPRRVTLKPYIAWMERTLGSPVGWPDEEFREFHVVYAGGQWVDRESAAAR